MKYFYGMRLRGFSPGCQPMNDFYKRLDSATEAFYDILVYNRALSEEEEKHYSLTPMYGYICTDNLGQENIKAFVTEEETVKEISNTLQFAYDEYCELYPDSDVTWLNRLLDAGSTSEVYVPDSDCYTKCKLYEPIVRIAEYVRQHNIIKPITIGNICFRYLGVNMYDDADAFALIGTGEVKMSFAERYEKAIAELKRITDGMSLEEAQDYFKKETVYDNINFYGDYVFVYTAKKFPKFIKFGVRMD